MFEQIPSDVLTPFTFVEFNSSQATKNLSGTQPFKVLVLGQKLESGTADLSKVYEVFDDSYAAKLFGWGSMLHHQIQILKKNNRITPTFAIALPEPGADSGKIYEISVKSVANSAKYILTFSKPGQSKKVCEVTSATNAETSTILNQLNSKLSALDIVGKVQILQGKLNLEFSESWSVNVSSNLALSPPTGESGRAKGYISITGTAKSDGSVAIYVGDRKYEIPVSQGDTGIEVLRNLKERITDDSMAYVSAKLLSSKVQVVAKQRGPEFQQVRLSHSYLPTNLVPNGFDVSFTPMTGGGSNPSIENALESIDETQYNVVISPYGDISNLKFLASFLEKRWGPSLPLDGHGFIALSENPLAQKLKAQINSAQITLIDAEGVPTPPFLVSAALGGVNAIQASIDPALPQQKLELLGVLPGLSSRKREYRDNLLHAGISTLLHQSWKVFIERLVTTRTTGISGNIDISQRDVCAKQTLSYLRWDLRNFLDSKFSRFKLAKDDTNYKAGQRVLTPKIAKAFILARFKKWENDGLVEGFEQFKADLVCRISTKDPNRLELLIPTDLINQLRVLAAQIAYLL